MSGNRRRKEQEALIQVSYRYAWSLNPNRHDAEDLVHDAWIKVSKRYGTVPDKALMFRSIRNLYIDGYRHAQRILLIAFDEDDPVWHDLAVTPD
jgi:DNA-directed RNA polymerase specialized sigma24 family protein